MSGSLSTAFDDKTSENLSVSPPDLVYFSSLGDQQTILNGKIMNEEQTIPNQSSDETLSNSINDVVNKKVEQTNNDMNIVEVFPPLVKINPDTTISEVSSSATKTQNVPKLVPANIFHRVLPASVSDKTSPNNVVKHVLVNDSEPNSKSVVQGFILNSAEKNLVLVSDSTKKPTISSTSTNSSVGTVLIPKNNSAPIPLVINGNLVNNKSPLQNVKISTTTVSMSSTNVSNLTISKNTIKGRTELNDLMTHSSSNATGFLRLSLGSTKTNTTISNAPKKILQCTSSPVSISSLTGCPNTYPNTICRSQGGTEITIPAGNIIRLAVKNGKLVPDMTTSTSSSVNPVVLKTSEPSIKQVSISGPTKQQLNLAAAPKQPMSLSIVPSIVPFTEAKVRGNALSFRGNILSSLLHKSVNENELSKKDPEINPLLSAVGLASKNAVTSTNNIVITSSSSEPPCETNKKSNSPLKNPEESISAPTTTGPAIIPGMAINSGSICHPVPTPTTSVKSNISFTTTAIKRPISITSAIVRPPSEIKKPSKHLTPIIPKPPALSPIIPVQSVKSVKTITSSDTSSPEVPLLLVPSTNSIPSSTPDSTGGIPVSSISSIKVLPKSIPSTSILNPPSPSADSSFSLVSTPVLLSTSSSSTTSASLLPVSETEPSVSSESILLSVLSSASESSSPEVFVDGSTNASSVTLDATSVTESIATTTLVTDSSVVVSSTNNSPVTVASTSESVVSVEPSLSLSSSDNVSVNGAPVVSTNSSTLTTANEILNKSKEETRIEIENPTKEVRDLKSPPTLSISSPSQIDPKNLLNWTEIGTGALDGSTIKFRINEFGMVEIDENIDKKAENVESNDNSPKKEKGNEDSMNKENFKDFLMCKESALEENENLKENRNLNVAVRKNKRKDVKHEVRTESPVEVDVQFKNSFNEKFDEIFNKKCESYKNVKIESTDGKKINKHKVEHRPKQANSETEQEILLCRACHCYGLNDEFFNSRACTMECERFLKQKFVLAKKREYEMCDLKRKKKDKMVSLLKKENSSEKPEDSPKPAKPETEVSDVSSMDVDEDPSSSCNASSNALQSAEVSDTNEDSNLETSSVGSDKSTTKLQVDSSNPEPSFNIFKSTESLKNDAFFTKITNPFRVGMKLEGIDPEHQSQFCVMTVADTQGYRLRLHFDGFSECHDFWVNANSPDIFPVGWCEMNKRKLNPPLGYSKESFNWQSYLKQCKARAAPVAYFRAPGAKIVNHFKPGMKLEAVDRRSSALICVATVADVIDSRLLVHFDSWGDVYDYWTDVTAPYIHPVGWCQTHNRNLTPPTTYKNNKVFVWDEYLKETKSTAVPARAFKPRLNPFKVGMKVEAVDLRVPFFIRAAMIVDIKEHQLKIAYEGFPDTYSFWLDCDDPSIYPLGWCQKTQHPLEPPPCRKEKGDCGVYGCKGYGHIKGLKFVRHFTSQFCPYSRENLRIDPQEHIPDRLQSIPDSYEIDEPTNKPSMIKKELIETLAMTSKALQRDIVTPPPDKLNKYIVNPSSDKEAISGKVPEAKKRGRKRKYFKDVEPAGDSFDSLRQEVIESVLAPGYTPNVADSMNWTKHAAQLGVSTVDVDPRRWTHKQVTSFVNRIYPHPDYVKVFSDQEIDGEAFLMLSQKDITDILGFKLGPAIKIFNAIVLLRQKIS